MAGSKRRARPKAVPAAQPAARVAPEAAQPAAPAAQPAAPTAPRATRELDFDDRLAVVLAFVGSGCLLILEIVAGRLLAPTLGVSLYTWTSVIGVVLAGVSLGNYLGGRLADRWPSRSTVALIYVAGSIASLTILGLVHYVRSLELPSGTPAIVQVLWLNAVLFLLPSTILGAATPVLTRISLHAIEEGGRVVGRIQAAASLGSIVGTFLTGFVLISAFGTRRIVAGVALTLLLLALAARPPWLGARVYELGSLGVVILVAGSVTQAPCLRESDYYCIKVLNVNLSRKTLTGDAAVAGTFRDLYLDRLLHGVADLTDPTTLYYPYEQLYAQAIARVHPHDTSVDAFFIGGGAYTFPRYVEASHKGKIVVAEIDPAVTRTAREKLGLAASSRMEIHHADARRVLRSLPPDERFDFVFGDAFNDFQVPYHLTTREFNNLLARHLKPDGLYLMNIIDGVHYDYLRSEVRTLRETFPYVGVISPAGDWPPRPKDRITYVLVAALHPPSVTLPIVAPGDLDAFMRSGKSVLLTDDHAPLDQLLAPTWSAALKDG
jgi:MFS family permease